MRFTFRCLDAAADAALVHSWVTRPYASFWGMLSATVEDVAREYAKIQSSGHHHALLGLDRGIPAFLMEEYQAAASPLANVYPVLPGDVGMHLLVAPPSDGPEPGYTAAVMDAVMARLFSAPSVERIVVEPDARNTKIHALNERLGFQPAGVVALPDKEALLSFCCRSDYLAARTALQATTARQATTALQATPSRPLISQGASL